MTNKVSKQQSFGKLEDSKLAKKNKKFVRFELK